MTESSGETVDALLGGDPTSIGPYKLVGRLGAGGMGCVYLGRSPSGRSVAVKVVRSELTGVPGFRRRFRREIEAARRVGGFWTAAVVDADPDAEVPWVASAYINAPDLGTLMGRDGPLAEPQVRRLGAGLAEALVDIHGVGLVHRDLKPSNILMTDEGPRVLDFGIAKALDGGTALTSTGSVVGTPAFMSPEQAVGATVDTASDIFSLGSVLAYAATGRGPFGFDGSAHALLYRVVHEEPDLVGTSVALCRLLTDCLDKRPADRPTAQQLLELLTTPALTEVQLPASRTGIRTAMDLPIWQQDTHTSMQTPSAEDKAVGREREDAGTPSSEIRPSVNWWSLGPSFQPPETGGDPDGQELRFLGRAPSPRVPAVSSTVDIGDRVNHKIFGIGTVVGVSGTGAEAQAVVDFDRRGRKRLLLRFAPMWVL
ncbi:protein kinase domain-containing protein [Streptomyces sp. NPDC054952]